MSKIRMLDGTELETTDHAKGMVTVTLHNSTEAKVLAVAQGLRVQSFGVEQVGSSVEITAKPTDIDAVVAALSVLCS